MLQASRVPDVPTRMILKIVYYLQKKSMDSKLKTFFTSARHYNVFRVLFEVSSQKVFQRLRGLILLGFPQFFAHHRPNIFQIQLRLDLAGHTDLPGFWC